MGKMLHGDNLLWNLILLLHTYTIANTLRLSVKGNELWISKKKKARRKKKNLFSQIVNFLRNALLSTDKQRYDWQGKSLEMASD